MRDRFFFVATTLILSLIFPAQSSFATSTAPITWVATSAKLVSLGIPVGKGSEEIKRSQCIAQELAIGLPAPIASKKSLTQPQRVLLQNIVSLTPPKKSVPRVNVSLKCQMGYFVKANKVARVFLVSTGRPGYATHTGTFKVGWQVDGWYESIEYKGAMMYRPKFFSNGQALHGMPSDRDVWYYPSSHGCVRMPKKDVDWLWKNMKTADRVHVY